MDRGELERAIAKAHFVFVKVNWTEDDFSWVQCTKLGLRDALKGCTPNEDTSRYTACVRDGGDLYVG